jgi:DNA repair photolyase
MHQDLFHRLDLELAGIPPQNIYMGWHTDPYQPIEAEKLQTRCVLELLLKWNFSATILTKSDLILRDLNILQKMNTPSVSISVAFTEKEIHQHFEGNTIDTVARIDMLWKLKAAGIPTFARLCSVIPFITDVPQLIDMLAPCTDTIWIYGLNIEDQAHHGWQNVQQILLQNFGHLKQDIETILSNREHAYWADLKKELLRVQKNRRINLEIHT